MSCTRRQRDFEVLLRLVLLLEQIFAELLATKFDFLWINILSIIVLLMSFIKLSASSLAIPSVHSVALCTPSLPLHTAEHAVCEVNGGNEAALRPLTELPPSCTVCAPAGPPAGVGVVLQIRAAAAPPGHYTIAAAAPGAGSAFELRASGIVEATRAWL